MSFEVWRLLKTRKLEISQKKNSHRYLCWDSKLRWVFVFFQVCHLWSGAWVMEGGTCLICKPAVYSYRWAHRVLERYILPWAEEWGGSPWQAELSGYQINKSKSKVSILSPHPGWEMCSADLDKYCPWPLGLYNPCIHLDILLNSPGSIQPLTQPGAMA